MKAPVGLAVADACACLAYGPVANPGTATDPVAVPSVPPATPNSIPGGYSVLDRTRATRHFPNSRRTQAAPPRLLRPKAAASTQAQSKVAREAPPWAPNPVEGASIVRVGTYAESRF